jgi:hypothetical protein
MYDAMIALAFNIFLTDPCERIYNLFFNLKFIFICENILMNFKTKKSLLARLLDMLF